MGLESFKTDGPRTRTPESQKQSQQKTFGGSRVPDYVDEFNNKYDVDFREATNDKSWIAEKVKEGIPLQVLVDDLHTIPHMLVSDIIDAVDEGHLEVDDIPEDTSIMYNGKCVKDLVEERVQSKTLDSISSTDSESTSSWLDSFMT